MCVARDCRTMLISIDGDQYGAPESPAHVVASSLPALHLLVCASKSEPCQPCVFHNLPCLPLQSFCICVTCRRCLSCLLPTLTLSIPSRPEAIRELEALAPPPFCRILTIILSFYYFRHLRVAQSPHLPSVNIFLILGSTACQSIQPPSFIACYR